MRKGVFTIIRSVFFIALLATIIASCKKDDDDDPDYVGNWAATGTIQFDDGTTVQMKEVIRLTEGNFTNITQVKNPTTNNYIDYLGMKGTMSVNGTRMNVTVTEAGVSTFDVSGIPTGTIKYYKSNESEFTDFMEALEMPTTFQSEYEVSGNQLILRTDYNGNGVFTDEDESTTYTRE